jgi:maltose O-acetyltransferase
MKKLIRKLLIGWKYRNIVLKKEGTNCNYKSLRSIITAPGNIVFGDHVHMGPSCELHGEGGIQIGNGVVFAPEVVVYTRSHNFDGKDLQALPFDDKVLVRRVKIDDYVWVGRKAIILPGVHIGKGAVIGAGAVVSKSIPDYGVAVGNPAKIVKYRDKQKFTDLENEEIPFVYQKLGHKKSFIRPDEKE